MANVIKRLMGRVLFPTSGGLVSFDDPYATLSRLLRRHRVTGILDAGASHGRVSQRLLRAFPGAHVYAFEPNPLYAERLAEMARRTPRFHPSDLALSDHDGPVDFYFTQSPGTASMFAPSERLHRLYPSETSVRAVSTVTATTIDHWVAQQRDARQGGPELHLMKFDIQGGELKALTGAADVLRTTTLAVYTEVFFNPLYEGGALWSEIDLCLRKSGFVLYTLLKPRADRQGALIQGNAVYAHAGRLGL